MSRDLLCSVERTLELSGDFILADLHAIELAAAHVLIDSAARRRVEVTADKERHLLLVLSLVELFDRGKRVSHDFDLRKLDVSTANVEVEVLVGNDEELILVGLALEDCDEADIAFHVHLVVATLSFCFVVEGHAEGVQVGEALRVIVGAGTVLSGRVRLPRLGALVSLLKHEGMEL